MGIWEFQPYQSCHHKVFCLWNEPVVQNEAMPRTTECCPNRHWGKENQIHTPQGLSKKNMERRHGEVVVALVGRKWNEVK